MRMLRFSARIELRTSYTAETNPPRSGRPAAKRIKYPGEIRADGREMADGIKSALAELGPDRPERVKRGQPSLFGGDGEDAPGGGGQLVEVAEPNGSPKGAGRPRGARNRSTEEWRRYLLSQGRSPALVLMDLIQRDPADLARELGCKRIEAMDRILRAAEALMPYLHQKQPTAVALTGDGGLFSFQMIVAGQQVGGDASVTIDGDALDTASGAPDPFEENTEQDQ